MSEGLICYVNDAETTEIYTLSLHDALPISTVKAGSFIGEVAMFSQTQRSADVLALTRCQLLFMSAEAFRGMMQTEPKLASAVLFALGHMMADRMVAGNDRLQTKASSEFLWL